MDPQASEAKIERTYEPSPRVDAQIDKAFVYHPPKPDQLPRYGVLRQMAEAFARTGVALTPESREQSIALTKIEEAVMFFNAAIARNE